MTYPITPPPELVQQWMSEFYGSPAAPGELALLIAARSAQWGSDQELEACCDWMSECTVGCPNEARAALAQPEPEYPSDKELLELMPETMRDEFSCIAKLYSDATGGQVEPGIFRVALNTAALEYAQAVLARYAS